MFIKTYKSNNSIGFGILYQSNYITGKEFEIQFYFFGLYICDKKHIKYEKDLEDEEDERHIY